MANLAEQLDAMLDLPGNWDGYGADPVEVVPVAQAKEVVLFLQTISAQLGQQIHDLRVYPSRVGGVQIEWEDDHSEHELEISPDGSWGFLHTDRLTGSMTERTFAPSRQVIHPGLLQEIGFALSLEPRG